MEELAISEHQPIQVIHYYDRLHNCVIVGEEALEYHINSGGNPADILPLAEVLLDDSINIPRRKERAKRNGFSREKAITDGMFLLNLIHAYDGNQTVGVRLMQRAWDIDIIEHSPSQVRKAGAFDSFANYQEVIGETNMVRRYRFDHLTFDDLVEHVKKITEEEGTKATIDIIDRRVLKERRDEPSSRVIRRLIAPLTFYDLYERAGLAETTHAWDKERYELFGTNFMWANDGFVPTADDLDYLSKRDRGPSTTAIFDNYDTLSQYQNILVNRFNESYQTLAEELKRSIIFGQVPLAIIDNAKSEREAIVRYLKFQLIRDFCSSNVASSMLVEAVKKLGTRHESELEEISPSLSLGLLKEKSEALGISGAIWPKGSGLHISKKVRGPSVPVAQLQIGILKEIKSHFNTPYKEYEQQRRSFQQASNGEFADYLFLRGREIRASLESEEIPRRLFFGVNNGKTMVRRFETFKLLSEVIPYTSTNERVRLSIIGSSSGILTDQIKVGDETIAKDAIKRIAGRNGYLALI